MGPARLLDLTRLVSRLGRGPMTGIDRVEAAYLQHLLTSDGPLFGLVRSAAGWLLLDRLGCQAMLDHAQGLNPLPKAGLLGRLTNRGNPLRAQAETAVRQVAIGRAVRPFLKRLMRNLPPGAEYLNVGHANLSLRSLSALHRAGLHISVMVHDSIPLDHPSFARPDSVAVFQRKLAAVSAHADRVIHLTRAQQTLTEAQLGKLGRVPPGLAAPLGVPVPHADRSALPPGLNLEAPYFVTLGTIEPRKNHALLLDIWERLGPDAPRLFIIGGRGWASSALLARLDALPTDGPVQVLSGLPDPAVAALLQNATALLAPSLAEGFGLPRLRPQVWESLLLRRICRSHASFWVTRQFTLDLPTYILGWKQSPDTHRQPPAILARPSVSARQLGRITSTPS